MFFFCFFNSVAAGRRLCLISSRKQPASLLFDNDLYSLGLLIHIMTVTHFFRHGPRALYIVAV